MKFKLVLVVNLSKKPIIFDVGANKGQSIDRFLKINNNSLIHSFEPNIDEFNYHEDDDKKKDKGKATDRA